jgi:hypothetical protein
MESLMLSRAVQGACALQEGSSKRGMQLQAYCLLLL